MAGAAVLAQDRPALVAIPQLGLRVQSGFRVTVVADADLANDIQAMTLDPQGRVVVTGPGYIKTLLDDDDDGRADRAVLYATPPGAGQGMLFDGPALYFSGNGWFSRYEDLDGDGVADRPPENLFPLGAGEHGGHAIRRGPDGELYLIGGNDTDFAATHLNLGGAPVREVEAGALWRIGQDHRSAQPLAHGFRNPWSFDFDAMGEVFTHDSDVDGDFFLPWYTPTRFYHVAYGGHHGWRLKGWKRGWARPGYYADTVETLAPMGRGSPTGLVCYRHRQFPMRYRGGLFALDWTFGEILFVPVRPAGASFQAQPEIFLEPIGSHGFAPTDVCVGKDGALFVCIGGRKTRGAVFRIDYAGAPLMEPVVQLTLNPRLDVVITAPQPLEAWSRAVWVPEAQELGAPGFLRVAADELIEPLWRVRAIEILTELFGGLPQLQADLAARAASPLVRARTAWSLGRVPGPNPSLVLFPLLADEHPLVRRCALEAVVDHLTSMESPELVRLLLPSLGHEDKRVRLAAARLASALADAPWQALARELEQANLGARLSGFLAQMWRRASAGHPELLEPLMALLAQTKDPELRLDTVRLIILALGDWKLENPSLEVMTGCEAAALPSNQEPLLNRLRAAARAQLPSGDADLDAEVVRLLAMLQDGDPRTARAVLGQITPQSPAPADFHLLAGFARLRAWPPELTPKVADALLALDRKLEGSGAHPKLNWNTRLTELVQTLLGREPKLLAALLKHPSFATPGHLPLAAQLGAEHQAEVAALYLAAARRDTNYPWSGPLVEMLSLRPAAEVRPLFRAHWNEVLLRDDLLRQLAVQPDVADREKFWQGLAAWRLDVARACVTALLELPRDTARTNLLAPAMLLRRLIDLPAESSLRSLTVALLNAQSGQSFDIKEPAPPAKPTLAHAAAVRQAYLPVWAWLGKNHPAVARAIVAVGGDDPAKWRATLKAVPWAKGDPGRGERVFGERGCALCHAGARPLGPDLAGVTARFSIEDLFNAIVFPSRDIAEPYRPTAFLMGDGSVVNGLVAHESVDGVMAQTDATSTEWLDDLDIVARHPSEVSFMPTGLLDGAKLDELADLYSYLKTLRARK